MRSRNVSSSSEPMGPSSRSRSAFRIEKMVSACATQSFASPKDPARIGTQFGNRDRASNRADVMITATTASPRFSSSRETTTIG
jgi:hypothetical protein